MDGLNLYAYCANHSVGYSDPSGYSCNQDVHDASNGNKGTGDTDAAKPYDAATGTDPVKPDGASGAQRPASKPGDADFVGPIPSGSWKLVPEGDGAHLVERSNVRGRSDLSMYDRADTPRYYPGGTPESAGQAHIRLHEATRNEGIKLRGGNAGMTDQQLINNYTNAYSRPEIAGIRGDLRTPDSSTVIATNVSPSEAMAALLDCGSTQ